MKILVYIGLPKTATTFLQTQVFPQMGESILYNPDQLTFPIMQLLRKQRLLTETEVANHRMMVDRISRENFGKTLVIVNEHLGYTSMNPDPEFGAKRLKQLFPEAHVVACLRYQTDWLLSYYRHFIDIGGYKNVKVFLGWNGTEFCHDCGYDNFIGNFRISSLDGCIDIYKLGWADYVSCFHQQYGQEHVTILWFEFLKRDKQGFIQKICNMLEVPVPTGLDLEKQVNRSPSALACKLTQWHGAVRTRMGARPRSVKFWNSVVRRLKTKRTDLGWSYWLVLGWCIFRYAPWQVMMKLMDNIYYVHWDLLAESDVRQRLDDYFKQDNLRLLEHFGRDEIPKKYLP